MKKKILSVVLCTAMVTSMLVGCGGKEKESSAPAADDSTSKTIAESTPAEDSSSEETPAGESGKYVEQCDQQRTRRDRPCSL